MNKEKIILLDRDGVINEDIGYLSNPSSINIYLDAVSFIKFGVKKKYKIFIVTNQSGIGRGFYEEKDFKMVMKSINKILNNFGIDNLDYFFCPHLPNQLCDCRKPKTGMVNDLFLNNKFLLKKSWMIGDKLSDVEFGLNLDLGNIVHINRTKKIKSSKKDINSSSIYKTNSLQSIINYL